MIEKAGDLAALLTNLGEGDVLFIDEIHRLNPTIEEVLYPAMEDYQLDIIIGQGPIGAIHKARTAEVHPGGRHDSRGSDQRSVARAVRYSASSRFLSRAGS